ncbi:MAG: ATP-binding protein, partial [Dehalococcoidia bacterium]
SLEPMPLARPVHEAVEMVAPLAAQRDIRIDASGLDACVHVQADAQRLKQVALNLLSNAVKYNREGGAVVLSSEIVADGRVRLVVRDTGPGIPADKLPRLFDPFDRLGAEATAIEGSGIGLALCERLMHVMNGAIGVDSEVGRGSAFWVELEAAADPLQRAPVHPPARGGADAAPGRLPARTVLYVEDNLSNVTLVQRVLDAYLPVRLLTAGQGRLGFDLAREHLPDLILLDLHLPDISGEEVLDRLRAEPGTRAIPIVLLTADIFATRGERLIDRGAQALLNKPIDVTRFLDTVRHLLALPARDERPMAASGAGGPTHAA